MYYRTDSRVSFRKLSKGGSNWRNQILRGGGGGGDMMVKRCDKVSQMLSGGSSVLKCVGVSGCVCRVLYRFWEGGGELQSLVLTWRGCIAHN